jgi:hypothetical protein
MWCSVAKRPVSATTSWVGNETDHDLRVGARCVSSRDETATIFRRCKNNAKAAETKIGNKDRIFYAQSANFRMPLPGAGGTIEADAGAPHGGGTINLGRIHACSALIWSLCA